MKTLATLVRHFLTALAGLIAYLATYEPTAAGGTDPQAALAAVAAVTLTRMILSLVAMAAGKLMEKLGQTSGGVSGLVLGIIGTAAGMGVLPSCAAPYPQVGLHYTALGGLQLEVRAAK
jgi:uncharacterized membrane protein YeaQ/YmgE (transglycosylase-associated protein family)